MPQVQSSLNGLMAPPVASRTSISGCRRWKPASRGISQRTANDGPTPSVSTGVRAHRGDLLGDARDRVEGRGEARLQRLALRRQRKPVRQPLEQREAEALLEQPHHAADRRLRDVELVAGGDEAAVARRRLEGAQSVERGQAAHRLAQLFLSLAAR